VSVSNPTWVVPPEARCTTVGEAGGPRMVPDPPVAPSQPWSVSTWPTASVPEMPTQGTGVPAVEALPVWSVLSDADPDPDRNAPGRPPRTHPGRVRVGR